MESAVRCFQSFDSWPPDDTVKPADLANLDEIKGTRWLASVASMAV